jgi:hypothetical protein
MKLSRNLEFENFLGAPEIAEDSREGSKPGQADLVLPPEDVVVDLPDVRQGNVVDVGLHLELPSLFDLLELLFGQPVLEGVFLLDNHLLLVSDGVVLSHRDGREHALWEVELKMLGVFIHLKGLVEFMNQCVCLVQKHLRKLLFFVALAIDRSEEF